MTARPNRTDRQKKEFTYPHSLVIGFMRGFALVSSKLLWSISFAGLENIPPVDGRGFIVAANHTTYFDPAWIAIKLKRPIRFMAWDRAFEWPLIGRMIRYLGAFPVKLRSGPAKSSITEAVRSLKEGAALVIFPEGEREFADAKFLPFKNGVVHLAMVTGVPILPVSIRGGSDVWPQGQKYPRFFRPIRITFHPLLRFEKRFDRSVSDISLEQLNERLVKTIQEAV